MPTTGETTENDLLTRQHIDIISFLIMTKKKNNRYKFPPEEKHTNSATTTHHGTPQRTIVMHKQKISALWRT